MHTLSLIYIHTNRPVTCHSVRRRRYRPQTSLATVFKYCLLVGYADAVGERLDRQPPEVHVTVTHRQQFYRNESDAAPMAR
jgi:hypothetical protein